jgi:hypothetical protein
MAVIILAAFEKMQKNFIIIAGRIIRGKRALVPGEKYNL